MSDIRIYVADLAAYNAGAYHGVWITIEGDTIEGDVWDAVNDMLKAGTDKDPDGQLHEEYEIHDHEGFEGLRPGNISQALHFGRMIDRHGAAFSFWVQHIGPTSAAVSEESAFEDAYRGCYDSLPDAGQELFYNHHLLNEEMKSLLDSYFDFGGWLDGHMGDDYYYMIGSNGSCHVFSNNV